MKHKSEIIERFKEFQSEVENHRNKKIKFLRSDRGEEYFSYEFGLQLKQCEIVSLLTPPGTPQHNGVSERHNRTLLDIVQSMMFLTDLPLSFWGYELVDACEPCLMGKMTKTPFSGPMERATDLLEIIHTDVCGPMNIEARSRYHYFLTFTDDLSRYGYIYLMKQKSGTFEKFI